MLKDVLEKVAENQTNVESANVRSRRGTSAIIKLTVDVRNIDHYREVVALIRKVHDVYDVTRAEGG